MLTRNAILVLFITTFSISSAYSAPAQPAYTVPQNDQRTYNATVTGGPVDAHKLVVAFHKKLLQIEGVSDLADVWIDCVKCPSVSTDPSIVELKFTFYREHTAHLKSFVKAWNAVHKGLSTPGNEHPKFILTFDAIPMPAPVCNPPTPPLVSPCANRPCGALGTCSNTNWNKCHKCDGSVQ